jgi:hypothetical protein
MPLYLNWTPATPTLSEASAVTLIVPETVAPDAGDVILTVGGVVSGGHVKPGTHGNGTCGTCAKAWSGIQAELKITNNGVAAQARFTIFSMTVPSPIDS